MTGSLERAIVTKGSKDPVMNIAVMNANARFGFALSATSSLTDVSAVIAEMAEPLLRRFMNKADLKALKESIQHWKRLATGKLLAGEGIGAEHCALCQLHFLPPMDCKHCPVRKRTGRMLCIGTPYYSAVEAHDQDGVDSGEFRDAAKKELAFLKSLLPKRKAPSRKK